MCGFITTSCSFLFPAEADNQNLFFLLFEQRGGNVKKRGCWEWKGCETLFSLPSFGLGCACLVCIISSSCLFFCYSLPNPFPVFFHSHLYRLPSIQTVVAWKKNPKKYCRMKKRVFFLYFNIKRKIKRTNRSLRGRERSPNNVERSHDCFSCASPLCPGFVVSRKRFFWMFFLCRRCCFLLSFIMDISVWRRVSCLGWKKRGDRIV